MRFRHIVVLAIVLGTSIFAIRVGWYHHAELVPGFVVDDAYISFRYARNLAEGEGLVFNPGERVEGYTNFLWTVLVAGGMALGVGPVAVVEALAASAGFATIVLLALLGSRLLRGPLSGPAIVLPPVLFAAVGSQARHVVSGMETLLFVLLVLAGFSALLWRWREADSDTLGGASPLRIGPRAALGAGILFAFAALTRPEGTLFTALGGLLVLAESGRGRLGERLRSAALYAGGFFVLYGPYTVWRVVYYGYLLPNTFYAKVAGPRWETLQRGWESLGRVMADWSIWPLIALALLALVSGALRDRLWAWLFGIAVATWLAFVFVGGDFLWFFGPRMLMPALPFVLLLAAEGLRRTTARAIFDWWRPRGNRLLPTAPAAIGFAAVGAVVVLLAGYALLQPWPRRAGRLGGIAVTHEAFHRIGDWLLEQQAVDPAGGEPPLLAIHAAGIIPYVTGWPVVDMYGLSDEHIAHHGVFDPAMPPAHSKSDSVYVLDRRPDYLVSEITAEGVARTARLGWVAGRVAREYELVAQVKVGRGPKVRGRQLIEVGRFRPDLHQRGYKMGIFRRRAQRSARSP